MPRHKWKRYNQRRAEGQEFQGVTKDDAAVMRGDESLPDNEGEL